MLIEVKATVRASLRVSARWWRKIVRQAAEIGRTPRLDVVFEARHAPAAAFPHLAWRVEAAAGGTPTRGESFLFRQADGAQTTFSVQFPSGLSLRFSPCGPAG